MLESAVILHADNPDMQFIVAAAHNTNASITEIVSSFREKSESPESYSPNRLWRYDQRAWRGRRCCNFKRHSNARIRRSWNANGRCLQTTEARLCDF
jgi:hypothetical protein